MTESKSRKARVVVLGDGWKNAIQGRMGSEEVRERMRLEDEAAAQKALQSKRLKEENECQEVSLCEQEASATTEEN
jgi:hypothetical protein